VKEDVLVSSRRIAIHIDECCQRNQCPLVQVCGSLGWEGVCKIVFEVGVSLQVMQDIDTLPVSSSQRKRGSSLNSADALQSIQSRAWSSREMICFNWKMVWMNGSILSSFPTGIRDEAKR
jgi:hypothetical protein